MSSDEEFAELDTTAQEFLAMWDQASPATVARTERIIPSIGRLSVTHGASAAAASSGHGSTQLSMTRACLPYPG
ncbi:hypothetical protein [Cellulomonas fimi]|uniref:Uncharacterized protein n=1 Tax=Cellulomonas fimi TaxID=1708 RepID=A0A7Y0LZW7_CELFI|nr:hypothetical protein [Cellulomonas fimi]NMR21296.1 hypothetical protein [Cellulomonas fimi]